MAPVHVETATSLVVVGAEYEHQLAPDHVDGCIACCEWRQRPTTFLYCSKYWVLLALIPQFTNVNKWWTDSAISTVSTTTDTNRCELLLYNWLSCNNPNL